MVARNGDVVYKIRKEGKKNGGKSIHINNLRRYDERKDFNRLDVVLEGEDDNDEENADREGGRGGDKNGKVNLSEECDEFDAAQLEALVQDFGNVFGENNMGSIDVVTLSINTQDAEPVSQPPYSVPLNL